MAARYAGDFTYEPKDPLLKLQIARLNDPPQQTRGASVAETNGSRHQHAAGSKSLDTPTHPASGPVLSTAQLAFRDEQLATDAWDKQTAAQAGATYRLFVEVCGDRPLADYTRKDAGRFRELASRLPADYGKSALYRGQTVEAILKIHSAQPADKRSATISQKTVSDTSRPCRSFGLRPFQRTRPPRTSSLGSSSVAVNEPSNNDRCVRRRT